jgi:UDP-glucuronate decarboxylase
MAADDGRVVSNFIVAALRGEYMKIFGDGKQTRSFCYVDDLIAGFMALMKTPKEFTGPINIGNPNEFSMWELAYKVREQIPSAQINVGVPLPQDDPKQRCPDITLARIVLGWEPKVQLKEGLEKTIEHFRLAL